MKFTTNLNGHTAANARVGNSYSQSDNRSDAASYPENADAKPKAPPISPVTEEDAFRIFLLNRLPEVKAPESLRQKIKNSIKNYRP